VEHVLWGICPLIWWFCADFKVGVKGTVIAKREARTEAMLDPIRFYLR
jgi:hypothetical protein